MVKQKEAKNSYDSVFDFIFSVQKKKKNKPFPKVQPEFGVYSSALIEIGTQPMIYPLESAFNSINSYVGKETSIPLGGGVSAGLGSSIFGDPSSYSNKELAKRRAGNNFARLGAGLHHGIDGALVSLYSKFNGASSQTAYVAGKLFSDTQRAKNSSHLFGIDNEDEKIEKEDELFKRGAELMSSTLARTNPAITKAQISYLINEGQKIPVKEERIRLVANHLKVTANVDPRESLKIANLMWGKDSDDMGMYKFKGDTVTGKLKDIEYKGEGNEKIKKHNKKVYDKRMQDVVFSDKEPKEKKREVYKILREGYKLDAKSANLVAEDVVSIKKGNDGIKIAEYSVQNSLVLDAQNLGLAKQDYEAVKKAREAMGGVLEMQTSNKSLGAKAARSLLVYNWVKDSGAWGSTFLNGSWEKLGEDDLNFTKIVQKKEVKDADGKVLGEYIAENNSVMGKLLGKFYYLHPNNLIKGLFLDGGLLLKWASDKDGKIKKKSLAYLLYNARIGKTFSAFAKPLKILSNKFLSMLNPLANGAKTLIKNILKKMLGATGLGGWILSKLMDIFGDRITYIVNQLVLILVLGVVGILFVLLESSGLLYSAQKVAAVRGESVDDSQEINSDVFTDSDFVLPSEK